MRGRGAHPDVRAIAEYQAGARTGLVLWRARRIAAHLNGCSHCQRVAQQLSSVSTALATAPAPTMPTRVARRVSAALSAEQTARASGAATRTPAVPSPASRRTGLARRAVLVPVTVVVASLALGGGLTLLARNSGTPGSVASSAGRPVHGAASPLVPPVSGHEGMSGLNRYQVISSGTDYRPATLRSQAAALLRTAGSVRGNSPSDAVAGCVSRVAGSVDVTVVDQADYLGKPAYIIVSAARAWVAGPGCSVSHSDLITSVGLSANR
jgi:hypothetical protein